MGFPLVAFLLVGAHGFEVDELVAAVENGVAFGAPADCVNGFSIVLDQVGS